MENNVVKLLKSAKAKIIQPVNWTQGAFAKDSRGISVDPETYRAVCFCSMGAIQRAWDESFEFIYNDSCDAMDTLRKLTPNQDIPDFNDNHTHAEVMALFDKAILSAEAAQ